MRLRHGLMGLGLVAGLAALTGCCGIGEKSTPAVDHGPPQAPPPGFAPPVAPTGDGIAGTSEALVVELDVENAGPTLLSLAGAPLVAKLDQRKAALGDAKTATDFAKAYRDLKGLSADLAQPMQVYFDEKDQAYYFDSEFFAGYPFYDVDYEAEGTAVIVMMTYPPLREQAKATPEAADDLFLDMLELLYRDARGTGWNSLEGRTWDYGGCNPLGNGQHLKILLAADKARAGGGPFITEIEGAREVVLSAVTKDDELFPYCGLVEIEGPTPKEKLRAETQQILDQVTLSDAERAALEARIQTSFGGAAPAAPAAPEPEADAEPTQKPRRGKMAR